MQQAVFVINHHNSRFKVSRFFGGKISVRNYNNLVTGLNFSCGGSVKAYTAGVGGAFYDISLKSFAVINVKDINFLACFYICGF